MSAVIYKERLLHENEIVQQRYNFRCYGVERLTTLKRPVHFPPAVQFLTSLNV